MRALALCVALFCAALFCGGCDGRPKFGDDASLDPSSIGDSGTDQAADISPADSAPTVDSGSDGAIGCAAATNALAAELYGSAAQTCTAVVRLDHNTLTLLGYQLFCGPYNAVDEGTARATAQTDTGYGGGQMLNPANPEDTYVFYSSPGDFGGVSAVSAYTGLTIFGGGIVWHGLGDITFPASWRSPASLGTNCPPSGGIPQAKGYDLVYGEALNAADVNAAVAVAAQTALPAAMWSGGYVFNAVVIRYPRSVGVFNPNTAEWLVILNSGWLE